MKRPTPHHPSLRALLGLLVIVLQVVGALHFSLVRHGYSAALGGVVHVHASSQAKPREKAALSRATALAADAPSCGAELCPMGNAPSGCAPRFEPLATGLIAFGEARLLGECRARSNQSQRLFPRAPKTSPPV